MLMIEIARDICRMIAFQYNDTTDVKSGKNKSILKPRGDIRRMKTRIGSKIFRETFLMICLKNKNIAYFH